MKRDRQGKNEDIERYERDETHKGSEINRMTERDSERLFVRNRLPE
jgi:hypothetical protein